MIAVVRLGAEDCSGRTDLLQAQTVAGLQMLEGSEVDLQMMGGFAAEAAMSPLCYCAVRLAGR